MHNIVPIDDVESVLGSQGNLNCVVSGANDSLCCFELQHSELIIVIQRARKKKAHT
jgi:hypothetical protein